MKARILLCGDFLFRKGFTALTSAYPQLELVAETPYPREMLQYTTTFKPDVVVAPICFCGRKSLRAICQMLQEMPHVQLCVVSRVDEYGGYLTAADDYTAFRRSVYHGEEVAELVDGLIRFAAGERSSCRTLTQEFLTLVQSLTLDGDSRLKELTDREREVLKLTADGFSIKEVAFQVSRSHKTIEACRRRVMKKLGIHSVAGLTKYAVMEGLSGLAAGLQNGDEDGAEDPPDERDTAVNCSS